MRLSGKPNVLVTKQSIYLFNFGHYYEYIMFFFFNNDNTSVYFFLIRYSGYLINALIISNLIEKKKKNHCSLTINPVLRQIKNYR